MTTPRFAATQAKANAAIMAQLANASVTIAGDQPSVGIFDNASAGLDGGVYGQASTQPTVTVPTASITGEAVGQAVVVAGTSYLIDAHEPDGTGLSRLLLVRA